MDEYFPAPTNQRQAPSPSGGSSDTSYFLRMLLVLLIVWALAAWVAPPVAEKIAYSWAHGRERAEVESARGQLDVKPMDTIGKPLQLVAQAVGPSVVGVDTVKYIERGYGVSDEYRDLFPRSEGFQTMGQGSGVIIDPDGYILTNNHVVSDTSRIRVQFSDGRILDARVIGADPATDLAVLKVNATGLIAAPWGDSDEVKVGAPVLAIGNPFGLARSVTFGIVSAKDRPGFASPYQDFLQTDAAVNPGNSGGPLVNLQGRVIGINTAIIGKGYQGVSFSIPSNTAHDVYERLRQVGKVARGWLGVSLREITPELAKELSLPALQGAYVAEVVPGSPAEKAGIRKGDVIVSFNGHKIDLPTTLTLLVGKSPIGKRASAVIIRDGKQQTVEVPIEERPARLQSR